MDEINYTSLSKSMTRALRHKPQRIGIVLAPDGSVELETLIRALNRRGGWPREITEDDVMEVVEHGTKRRFAVEDGRIRATYGHSVPHEIAYVEATPPDVLYHGTNDTNARSIVREGLRPMGRQMVHLSADLETARTVGRRHRGRLVLLSVDAARASAEGITFFTGNDSTWLCRHVPQEYLAVIDEGASGAATDDGTRV